MILSKITSKETQITVELLKTPRVQLTKKQNFDLMSEIQKNYTESGLGDKEFAEKFSVDFFFVNANHVGNSRDQLGIPARRFARTNADKTAAEEVLAQLASVEGKLDRLLKYFSEQARRDL